MANKERIQKWVDALLSGKFSQGKNALRTKEGNKDLYCCLGVLCEVAIEDGVPLEIEDNLHNSELYPKGWNISYDAEYIFPPDLVYEWIEIERFPEDDDDNDFMEYARLNDNGRSFSYIAERIREKYLA